MDRDLKQKCSEYGAARLAICQQARSLEDWQRLWFEPANPYVFRLGDCWKPLIEYCVEDYAAEVGFFLDLLGLNCNVLADDFAMLMGPEGDYFFSLRLAAPGAGAPATALRLQFLLSNVEESAQVLTERGLQFETPVAPVSAGSAMLKGTLRTPNGIAIDLWGLRAAVA